MTTRAVLYARVSSEEQTKGDAVSLDEQLADMRVLAERSGWEVLGEFVDCRNYRATQAPKRGKMVNPSGERADRPEFLAMLEEVRSGRVDAVICWRDDRLMRHPRVAVALEDALDLGDRERPGKAEIGIYEATGAKLDRFTMHIKASVWREENKRRAERMKMAKIGTLKEGRWPGSYKRFGYKAGREAGKRGRKIELGDPAEIRTVRNIFHWYEAGGTIRSIRQRLIAEGAAQKGLPRIHEWNTVVINAILRAEDYAGLATWNFKDCSYSIEIPAIVDREQWDRVQERLDNARRLSNRKSGWIYLLQNIAFCGSCGRKLSPHFRRYAQATLADGTKKRYDRKTPQFDYKCCIANQFPEEVHPRPYGFAGIALDWDVWRYIVDNGIKRPDVIREQVQARQAELIAQGEGVDGDVAHVRHKLEEVKGERAFYQRQGARGKISEAEFDQRMAETEKAHRYWTNELERLQELRDDTNKVQAGLEYATELLRSIRDRLALVDMPPQALQKLPKQRQREILKARQKIVRALCDKVTVFADRQVKIEGVIDGSEAAQFMSVSPHSLPLRQIDR